MTSRFTELIIDCHQPRRLAEFWCSVLGYRITDDEEDIIEIAGWEKSDWAAVAGPRPPALLFIQVPESKATKNRLHIDVNPAGTTQDEEVERLLGLGATRVDIGQGKQNWVVLADPEGNEFCVLRSVVE